MGSKTKILIVDDHVLVSEGIATILNLEDDLAVVGIISAAEDTSEAIQRLEPDLTLIDFDYGDGEMTGIDAIEQVRVSRKDEKFILLTYSTNEIVIRTAINAEIDGYVVKGSDSEELINAIDIVSKGGVYYSDAVREFAYGYLWFKQRGKQGMMFPDLTPRENDVLALVARRYPNWEIAKNLRIEEKTVRNHISSIYKKLGVDSRDQLFKLATGAKLGQ